MDEQFWHRKWQINEIGFHEAEPNPHLVRNLPALGLPPGARLLLPLCGKSRDIHWLVSQNYKVAGIELSRLAVEQLFDELGIVPDISEIGPLQCFETTGLTIFIGNVFDLNRDALGKVDAIYDRAALVALPEPMRNRYAAHLITVTDAAPQLLVCYEYDQTLMNGPPFSVTETEVRQHFEGRYRLTRLESLDVKGGLKGICPSRETIWLLEPR